MTVDELIKLAFSEDIGDGDHTTLATVDASKTEKARLLVKEDGIVAGVDIAVRVFRYFDPTLSVKTFIADGSTITKGDIVLEVEGKAQSILTAERLVLNIMQRMSGIATTTAKITELINGTGCKLLDTRKTTPNFRYFEKLAVKIGGGHNHRIGLYDMILIKDNHIDYAGGIEQALERTFNYLKKTGKNLEIEIEVRNTEELLQVLKIGGIRRVLLDNFTPDEIGLAVETVRLHNSENGTQIETEASGGITLMNIRSYAVKGVDYISVGALTHHVKSLDLSLKAVK